MNDDGPPAEGARSSPRPALPSPGPPESAEQGSAIPSLREQINGIDSQLLELLAERRRVSSLVAENKAETHSPVRDQKREEELLGRLIRAGRDRGLDAYFVTRIFQEIIDDSLRVQQKYLQDIANAEDDAAKAIRVAFQGIEGAYSHLAAQSFFARELDRLVFSGLNTFAEVIQAVEEGRCDYGMLPVENTTSGSINEVYDLLLHTRLSIVGEEKFRVKHCLVGAKDVPLSRLRKIYSHPQAVAQCSHFLANLASSKVEYYTDTAMSVSKIKEEADPAQAAIASEQAAQLYGLHILATGIANQPENFTRFLIVARNGREVDLRIPCKTSIVMATGQAAGSLVDSLIVLREHGVNLTKLESRPILGNPWEEMFYLDFEGNIAEERVEHALEALRRVTRFLKILGTYPSRDLPPTSPSMEAITHRTPSEPGAGAASAPGARPAARSVIGAAPGQGYRLVSRQHKQEDTVVDMKGASIGDGSFVVLAGPPPHASPEMIARCAREIKEHGGQFLIAPAGCSIDPQTGTGREAGPTLQLVAETARAFGLPLAAAVVDPREIPLAARTADALYVDGVRMEHPAVLEEVGRVHRPVILQRSPTASIDEFLAAAERVVALGNHQVVLCVGGVRTLETPSRRALDLETIAILRERTHLPILVDPATAGVGAGVLLPLARAMRALGAAGVVLAIQPDNETTAGGATSEPLTFSQFAELMDQLFA